jgi:hypothetical protein
VLDRFSRKTTESSLDLWIPPGPLNAALEQPLNLEAAVIARGGRIPAGLSLLAVLRRPLTVHAGGTAAAGAAPHGAGALAAA